MNVKLLRKIQKMILAHPEHFDMRRWYSYKDKQDLEVIAENNGTKDIINFNDPECGTTACIAGWALALDPESRKLAKKVAKVCSPFLNSADPLFNMERAVFRDGSSTKFDFSESGAKALDLNKEQADRLFLTILWPQKFCLSCLGQTTPELASARIDYFIESGGY